MAEAVDDGRVYGADSISSSHTEHGLSDQLIDPWCDQCYDEAGQKIEARGFCPDCNSFICEPCINAHKKVTVLRKHRIQRGNKMPKAQADKPVKYQNCAKHAGNVKDHFCLDHIEMVCSQCIKETHERCNSNTISGLCRNIGSSDIQQLTDTITTIKKTVSSTQLSLQYNMIDIELQRKDMIKEAEMLRDKVIEFARTLCSDTTTNITAACRQTSNEIADQVSAVADMAHCLDETHSDINKAVHATVGPNQFIRLQDTIENARQYKEEIENMRKHLHKIELSFSCSSELSGFLTSCKQLGDIKENLSEFDTLKQLSNIDFPKSVVLGTSSNAKRKQREISKLHVTKLKPLNANTAGDEGTCNIKGMTISKGYLHIVDVNSCTVKILSPDNQVLSSFSLFGFPTDITVINDKTEAISIGDGKIHILEISDPAAPSVQRTISLTDWIANVTMCNNNLVVVFWGDPTCVKMIDLNGRELWSVSGVLKGQQRFESPWSVISGFLDDKTMVIVTDPNMETLTVLDASNGNLIRTIDVKGKGPHGLTTDDNGNVYVCYKKTKEICVWSADLSQCRILLSENNIQEDPNAIVYNNTTDELFVGYSNNDLIDRFQLS